MYMAPQNREPYAVSSCGLERERLQVFPETLAQVLALEGEVDGRLEHAGFVAGIVACALKAVTVDLLVFEQTLDAVGELEFTTRAERRVLQKVEDGGGEDVATDDGIF